MVLSIHTTKEGSQVTYGQPPNPEVEKARLQDDARRSAENLPGMQHIREAQSGKADAQWQGRQVTQSADQAKSFFGRIASWFKRS
jgi:hypothetical protein